MYIQIFLTPLLVLEPRDKKWLIEFGYSFALNMNNLICEATVLK